MGIKSILLLTENFSNTILKCSLLFITHYNVSERIKGSNPWCLWWWWWWWMCDHPQSNRQLQPV